MADRIFDDRVRIHVAAIIAVATVFAGCASQPDPLAQVRADAAAAHADRNVKTYAAGSLAEARRTLALAAEADSDELRDHLIYVTERNLDTARAIAARQQAEQERDALRRGQTAAREPSTTHGSGANAVETSPVNDRAPQPANAADRSAQSVQATAAKKHDREALDMFRSQKTFGSVSLTISDLPAGRGSEELTPDAKRRLDGLGASLQQDAGLHAIIEGHSDNVGGQEANLRASLSRAKSVKMYLVDQGIEDDRIRTLGQGAKNPIASNETPEGRSTNRRVEIAVYRIGNPPNQNAPRP